MFSTFFLGALYLEHVLGYSPITQAWPSSPGREAMAVMSAGITARLVSSSAPNQ